MNFSKRVKQTEWGIFFSRVVIVIVFIACLALIVAVGFYTAKGVQVIGDRGLKNVLERVWEGSE